MADDQPQVPGSNDELDKLVKQCEAAAEAVTVAKRNGDKPRIDADVKALVALKEQITAIAPDHPLALKDKKKAKKGGNQQAANDPNKPLSKNAQKALAKKQAKEARKAKAAAEAEKDKKPEKTVAKRIAPPLPQEPAQKDVVSYGPDRIPLAAMAANALCGGPLTFCCDEGMKGSEPSFVVDGVTVHGSSTAARYAFTTSLSPLSKRPWWTSGPNWSRKDR